MTLAIFVAGVIVGLVFSALLRRRAPRMASSSVPGLEAIRERAENAEKDALSRLESFFAPEAAKQVLENPRSLDPQPRSVAVLVIGVRDWNGWCASRSPQEVAPRLNELLDPIVRAALRNHGTIDKFLGAGAVIFFGAPIPYPDAAAKALACMTDASRVITALPRPARIFAGLHWGEAAVGTFGASVRQEYTVAGDVVNVAHGLARAAERDDITALGSDAFARSAGGDFARSSPVSIDGRPDPVDTFRLG